MFNKIFPLTFCLVFISITARSQQPVPATQIETEIFVLDSSFQIPTKSLPFDRNFKLQFIVPSTKAKVLGFVVLPVNRKGEKAVTRRDYRIYLRTLSPDRNARRVTRNTVPFAQFQDTTVDASIFYKKFAVTDKGKKSEVTLLMPKLEPRRNYMVRIYFKDEKAYDLLIALNKPFLEVLTSKASVNLEEFSTLKKNYEKLTPKNYRGDDLFQVLSQKSFENDISTGVKIEELVDTTTLTGYAPEIKMHFIFSRGTKTDKELAALPPERFLSVVTDHIPSRISLAMVSAMASAQELKDADGQIVNFTESKPQSAYKVYLVVSGTKTKIARKSEPKPFDREKSVHVADVVFLGNDPKVIRWKPLPALPDLENDDKFIADLKTAVNYASKSTKNPGNPLLSLASYQALTKAAISCPCKEIGILKEADRDELLQVLGFVYNLPANYLPDLSTGEILPARPYQDKPENDAGRLANYESSLKTIDVLEGLVRMVPATVNDAALSAEMDSFVKDLQAMRVLLNGNKTALESKIKASNKMAKYFTSAANTVETTLAFRGSTEVYNFTTASKLTFQPDFGLVVIPNFSGKKISVRELVPYFGVNINFRSIDREIPMSKIDNKHWSYYFSFLLGVSLASINIPDQREDLFGTSNSLMAGIGFRLNRYIKVIGGSVIFKTLSTNPLSDRKSIGASAFTGLSADFEIYELFNGLKKIIK